jgi:S-adenosyl-L-methionine hydrolase (adenosine-forming)
VITLTTDFGADSPYVAAMKGVILSINPNARIVDLSHQIPPQDVHYASFFLRACIPYFPAEAIHVMVVDPGVGTDRAVLYAEIDGHRLLAPDNGCWTGVMQKGSKPATILRLTESRFWRQPVSATFHGRDIFAPVAAHLSLGENPGNLGQPCQDWIQLERPSPIIEADRLVGEIVFIDHFGNLITNIPGEAFARIRGRQVRVLVNDQEVTQVVRTYGEAEKGTVVALVSSSDLLEVAVTGGSAEKRLGTRVGTPISVRVVSPSATGESK